MEWRNTELMAHLETRIRFSRLVKELCQKYRREFSAALYARANEAYQGNPGEMVEAMNARESRKLNLLVHFGGLASGVSRLNDVSAADFAHAVDAFAAHFGLGDLPGEATAPATVVPSSTPNRRPRAHIEVQAAPW